MCDKTSLNSALRPTHTTGAQERSKRWAIGCSPPTASTCCRVASSSRWANPRPDKPRSQVSN
eukprot:3149356-Rhodomonas_salina.8